ncbi:hypothetical protein BIY24_13945 [Halobacteriovorax marinus]|nr:hypothetical protein BIY24_13945 [Halobacteriovorax marinus]
MDRSINILPIISIKSSFTLMLAPPGWGKTTLVLDLYEKFNGRIIFVSPLRALAEEFVNRATHLRNVLSLSDREGLEEKLKKFSSKKKGLLVCTAERLGSDLIERFSKEKTLFIFDEFHLFYYWGQSFRPLLWERAMEVSNNQGSILGLTATMDEEVLKSWSEDFSLGVEERFLINLGNQRLFNHPSVITNYNLAGKMVFQRNFINILKKQEKGTILYFCRFRTEVDMWLEFCFRHKISAIGCVGGEVESFLNNLESNPRPRCIFSTSALSHGVNLPIISKVFLSYEIENKDFWIQMVGRGGRDGSCYHVYEMEKKDWRDIRYLYQTLILLIRDFIRFRLLL